MCAEGDVEGIVELLKAIEEDPDEGDMSPVELLRYQDPLDGNKTGLHVAMRRTSRKPFGCYFGWRLGFLARHSRMKFRGQHM